MYVLHLSIYFCIEGEQRIDDREREGEREIERETAQHCSRRRERIITSFSLPILTRSSNNTSYSRGNESG
jgi:hypothetical protein